MRLTRYVRALVWEQGQLAAKAAGQEMISVATHFRQTQHNFKSRRISVEQLNYI